MNNQVKVSLNFDWEGKPTKEADGRMTQNGERKNLGYGWRNGESPYEWVFDAITQHGAAIGPYLVPDAGGHRNALNFQSHSLVLVDIDSGMRIEELFEDELYDKYGAGFYNTPSHTEENHKFRIIFRVYPSICDVNDMRHMYNALIKYYGGDKACKDGARLFFGTVNAKYKECRENVLPTKMVRTLIKYERNDELKRFVAIHEPIQYQPQTDEEKKQILNLLQQTFVGAYPIWRSVGWGLRSGGFTLQDFKYVTTGMMNKKTPEAATIVWNDWNPSATEKISMGTVIHILRERWGHEVDARLRVKEKWPRIEKLKQKQVELRAQLASLSLRKQ